MKPLAWRVGLFALAGVALLSLAVVLVGGHWFVATEQALMRFQTSVYGLQEGAPVVFRGVRVGQVAHIGLAPPGPQGALLPVTAQLDRGLLKDLLPAAPAAGQPVVPQLVAQGLVARLATQSLLTGLLYVELDFAKPPATPSAASTPPLIPTEPTRLQTLQSQVENLDFAQLGRDLSAVAASLRALLADPRATQALVRTADAAQAVEALARRLDAAAPPLLRSAEATLAEGRGTLRQAGPALQRAADQVGAAASQVQGLAAAGTPVLAELKQAGAELARTASVLRDAAGEDSALRLNADRALQDVARAARSLRELSELLEQQPDVLLRGRATPP
jgi:paraquat-inducible protein B